MIELAQHIEALLLENDCVIVPGLGGFVSHYTSSVRVVEEHHILPPARVIGFNPSLKMNDGLLVQSYASVYGTSFSDATRRVEYQVTHLLHQLHEEGKVDLPNIGELHYSIYGSFSFQPYDHKLTTPYLYGMTSFELHELKSIRPAAKLQTAPLHSAHTATTPVVRNTRRALHIPLRASYLRHAASIVAVIVLFFLITTPIENTGVIESNYAQLLPNELFARIGQTSLVTTPVQLPNAQKCKVVAVREIRVPAAPVSKPAEAVKETPKPAKKPAEAIKETSKPVQKPAAAIKETPKPVQKPAAAEVKKTGKPYHIIVASVSTEADARRMANQLKQNGYAGASAVIGGGKMRVSIQTCQTQQEAYQFLKEIRANKTYQSAWVLH